MSTLASPGTILAILSSYVSVFREKKKQVLSAANRAGLLFADKVRDEIKLILAQEEFW